MRFIGLAVLLMGVVGCATTGKTFIEAMGVEGVVQEKSSFDGSTVITAKGAWVASEGGFAGASSTKIGARWSSAKPEYITLTLRDPTAITNYQAIEINIDGQIESQELIGSTRFVEKSSEHAHPVNIELVRRMVAAEDCRIRIHRSEGLEEIVFTPLKTRMGAKTAKAYFIEMLEQIDAFQAAS